MAMAAWPADLHVTPAGESLLVMPEIPQAREIHDFYGPASRERYFPGATWADCLHVAEQVAATVAEVHAAGFIVADLNEQNFLVSQDHKVTLIDCDSLMSRNDGQTTFGGPYRDEWLPPELIGVDFSNIERTQNHDNFQLALMLFRILMQGRHPFVGAPTGANVPDDAEAVRSHQYVYGGLSPSMAVPPSAPPIDLLPKRLQGMFALAFGAEGRGKRPEAKDWLRTLKVVQRGLRECSAYPVSHVYAGHLGGCPWCASESVTTPFRQATRSARRQLNSPGVATTRSSRRSRPPARIPLQSLRVQDRLKSAWLCTAWLLAAAIASLYAL